MFMVRKNLIVAIVIGLVLLVTACGKLFYPAPSLILLDRVVGGLELVLIFFLLAYRHSKRMWGIAALVFATWGGYAGFWACVKLPCGCMGELVHIPSGWSLAVDGVFVGASLWLVGALKTPQRVLLWGSLPLAATGGVFMAQWVYRVVILAPP